MKTEIGYQVIGTVYTDKHFGFFKDVSFGIFKTKEEAEQKISEIDQEGYFIIYEAVHKYNSDNESMFSDKKAGDN